MQFFATKSQKHDNMAGDARWRTWDLDCLDETFVVRKEEEIEPVIVPGCRKEISSLNLGSIVLPKEAFFTSNDAGARLRARGRGRSLTNRALGLDKPSRRPGEKDISNKSNSTIENRKTTTLGSQFFGSNFLYEELFPSLDQSSTKISAPLKPQWCDKQKSKKGQQRNEQATNNESSSFEKSTRNQFESKQSEDLDNNTNDGQKKHTPSLARDILKEPCVESDANEIKLPSSTFYNCANNAATKVKKETENNPVGSDHVNNSENPMNEIAETLDTSENDSRSNMVGFSRIESISSDWQSDEEVEDNQSSTSIKDDNFQDTNYIESKDIDDDKISNHLLNQIQLEDNSNKNCLQDADSTQNYNSNDSYDAKPDYNQQTEDSGNMSDSTNHLLSDSEGCVETTGTKENLEESLNMSTSDIETEPCNVLMENLPLSLTPEELQEIVEPYGIMQSYSLKIMDSSKACTIRMPNSMSGELLVVSLDGLEMDGYRIKAQIDET